jgi:hypothetical protein
MQLSAVALAIAMSLAMSDGLDFRAGEGGGARQRSFEPALESISRTAPNDVADQDRIRKLISPHIEGDALIIEGKIDSHIYDYIQYEASRIVPLKVIELNSLGGSNEWALEIARKVKELGKTTVLLSGHYCASACSYIFAAGRERVASEDTWIGIHGARLGVGYLTSFQGLCFVDLETGTAFEPGKKGCRDFLAHWHAVALASTNEAFDAMEANGVSPDLRKSYFQMPDDPDWPAQLNVIGKPDWRLTASEALKYRLVTSVLPRTAY